MLYNEELISPQGDLDAMEWRNHPPEDSLGSKVVAQRAFKVKTREELARVLEAASEAEVLVRPAGALTSSKAFVAPPKTFMDEQRKKGVWLVGFDPSGEFGEIDVNFGREEVTVGAAVSLRDMDDAVRERTRIANGSSRPRLANVMRITTMDALAVATALGSGGVSDAAESSISAMTGSTWMDGRGIAHRENYDPSKYFDSESSSFARVNHRRVGKEMSGRGGPFGIGLSARFKLVEAPISTNTAVFPFFGGKEEVRAELAKFTLDMNRLSNRLEQEQSSIQVASMEVMDLAAMNVAAKGTGSRPFKFSEDPAMIVIVEFSQYDFFDEGMPVWSAGDALTEAVTAGLVPDSFYESVQSIAEGTAQTAVTKFRLLGPEHLRSILKQRKLSNAQAGSESTDWAVDPSDENLVGWYFERFFALHDQVQAATYDQALYGHLFKRLDLHHRVIVDEPRDLRAHIGRSIRFGHEVAVRQKEGQKVRVRGEKVENPFSEKDMGNISSLREGAHCDSNRRLLRTVDPKGLFKDRAAERWGGKHYY